MNHIVYNVIWADDEYIPPGLAQLIDLGDHGKLDALLPHLEGQSSSWERLCALEDCLIRTGAETKGWVLARGCSPVQALIDGWAEHEGWIYYCLDPTTATEAGVHIVVMPKEVFVDIFHIDTFAAVPFSGDSGAHLDAAIRKNMLEDL